MILSVASAAQRPRRYVNRPANAVRPNIRATAIQRLARAKRSEEHTSELQSRLHLVCRLLLEKKQNLIEHPGPELQNLLNTLQDFRLCGEADCTRHLDARALCVVQILVLNTRHTILYTISRCN